MNTSAKWLTLSTALFVAACAAETAGTDVDETAKASTTTSSTTGLTSPSKSIQSRPLDNGAPEGGTSTSTSTSTAAAQATLAPSAAAAPVAAAAAPTPVAATTAGAVARPAYNTGKGFFVSGAKLYDANGVEFRMRGVNQTHWWGGTGEEAIVPIAKAGANTARAVFGPSGGASTPSLRQSVVEQYVAQGVVPVVDYHNATCSEDPAGVSAAVDFWTGPDKAWLQSLERYTILNITNEWGPNSAVYRDTYVSAIARLRQAGIKNTLVIDAGGACGQLADSIETYGKAIFDSDPEKNVVFSIHMYGFWKDPGDPGAGAWDGRQPYDIDKELTRFDATGLPIIVGEFSWQGFHDVTYTTRAAVTTYEKHGVGWLAWMWFNPGGEASVNMANSNAYDSSADLTDFGKLLVDDPTFGWKAKAVKATVF